MLSNDYFLEAGRWYAGAGGVCALTRDGERMLTPLPIFHMNAMAYSFMAMVRVGGCLTALDRFHPRSWWASVRDSKASCLHYLGVMPSMLMGAPEGVGERDHAVRFGFGAGVDPKLQAAFEARFGFPLVEAWAMTETGAGAVIAANREPRRVGEACLGRPEAPVEVRVIDEAGHEVEPGAPGELLVRRAGDHPRHGFFSEYWKNPGETAKAWEGGWFHTGDVVRQEPSGDMFFVDRRKNVIRRSGENIAAVEVESVLMRHPAVIAAGVAAVPDAVRGDEVFACLVVEGARDGALAERLVDWALGQMAYYKVPGYIAFVDALPLTATNKIQRAALKELAARLVDEPEHGGHTHDEAAAGGMSQRAAYDGVVLTAPCTVPYERYSTATAHHWLARALKGTLDAAGLAPDGIDGFSVASFTLFPDTPVGLTQHLGLCPRWLDSIPMGGASGVVALRRAARAVQAGDADIVACVAGDTNQIDSFRKLLSSFSRFAVDAAYPYGYGGPNAMFALLTDRYMTEFGAVREDFGRICVAQRDNALRNPHALMKKPLSMADYLGARPVADPLALFDCVMPCAGAEAFLVMREDEAVRRDLPFARIAATIERHNAYPDDPAQLRGGWAVDVDELWSMAGCGPSDIDLVQTYDDYPVISMLQFEDLGFCAKGEAPAFLRARDLTIGGDLPHNTSGGQLSAGQAGAAGGFIGLVEALRQVTGQAGPTQVERARRALVSGFGVINYDRGVCSGAAVIEGGA